MLLQAPISFVANTGPDGDDHTTGGVVAERRPSRILVVEDDDETCAIVRSELSAAGYVVDIEPDGTDIANLAEVFLPDLALLETRLATGPDGFSIAALLRRSFADIPILFVTAAGDLSDRLAGFEAGADDYLVKPFPPEELRVRVNAVLRRSGRLSSKVVAVGDLLVHPAARKVVRRSARIELTSIEFELLSVFLNSPRQTFSKRQLLGMVWGPDVEDTNLVEARMSVLRRKLEAHGPRLIHTHHGLGYVLRP